MRGLNEYYPLGTPASFICWSGADQRPATASKRGTAVGLPQRVFLRLFAVHKYLTATQVGYSPQVRHDSVARSYNTLYRKTPAKINPTKYVNSQVLSIISRLTSCAALLCRTLRRVADLCSSNLSDTANRARHGSTLCSPTVEKILCRSLIVSALQISPCPLREKG